MNKRSKQRLPLYQKATTAHRLMVHRRRFGKSINIQTLLLRMCSEHVTKKPGSK